MLLVELNPVDNELIPVEADVESDVIELLADDNPVDSDDTPVDKELTLDAVEVDSEFTA